MDNGLERADLLARQQAAALAFGRRTNARPRLSVLMQDAAALVAETLEAELGGVGEVVADGTTLTLTVGWTDAPEKAVDPLVHKSSLAADESMAGYALNTASPVVTSNLAAEERFTDVFLRKLEMVSAMTVPLHLNRQPFGSLGVYSKRTRDFTPEDIHFAETIAHLLTSSVARVKAEQALEQQHAFASTVLKSVDSLVLVLDAEGKLVHMNPACQRTTGFSIEDVHAKPFCNVFVAPEEIQLVEGILRSTAGDKSPCEFESSLLTKHGDRRNVSWSLRVLQDEHEAVGSLVLTGTDRTEQLDTQAELERAKAMAEKANRTLEELRQQMAAEHRSDGPRIAVLGDALGEILSGEENGDNRQAFPPGRGRGPQEQRSSPRKAFHYLQPIAPIYHGRLPSHEDFFDAVCENISGGGIAFYLNRAPDFQDLVVALGQPPNLTHFSARVVRVAETLYDGKQAYLVGCRFTGRVQL